jgi:hypothetical protein
MSKGTIGYTMSTGYTVLEHQNMKSSALLRSPRKNITGQTIQKNNRSLVKPLSLALQKLIMVIE